MVLALGVIEHVDVTRKFIFSARVQHHFVADRALDAALIFGFLGFFPFLLLHWTQRLRDVGRPLFYAFLQPDQEKLLVDNRREVRHLLPQVEDQVEHVTGLFLLKVTDVLCPGRKPPY